MKDKRNQLLIQYSGFAAQLTVSLLLAVYAGDWVDKKLNLKFPLLLLLFTLIVIVGMMIKVFRDTSNK
ncbi:MAG: AtpZ/AtpI family protein [Bacteroidota bacterium]|nr:AtpZ/AtpI family protein [Bacteroidota bacterium]